MLEGIEQPNKGKKIRTSREKETDKSWNIETGHHQTSRDERKKFKNVSQENEKTTQDQTTKQKSHQRDKYLDCLLCKILGYILKVDKKRTLRNGPENKKLMKM